MNNMYSHKGMPFAETEFSFEDNKGGLAIGAARIVTFVHHLKD
jgi:hypothetical protein